MAAKPSTVVVSVTDEDPIKTVKLMLGVEDLPEAVALEDGILAFPLHLDTKYYTADINLCTFESTAAGSDHFAQGVGAFIIKFDSQKGSWLEDVSCWLPSIERMSPEVQILLCDQCIEESPSGNSRLDVQKWCVENRFELVELNPEEGSDEDEEMALPGLAVTTGIARVMQALQSHLWPNMQVKDKKTTTNLALAAQLGMDPVSDLSDNLEDLNVATDASAMISRIDQLLGADGDGGESDGLEMAAEVQFAGLLSRLSQLREQASAMPSEQRKLCAEQVVKAFWGAIGGDEDEVLDEILDEFHTMHEPDGSS